MAKAPLLIIGALVALPGCATLVNGTSQTVTVSTAPPGASCVLDRIGQRIGAIGSTPGSVRIDKSKNDLSVTCSKEGYQTASVVHSPAFNGATFGNLIAGGVIGVVVDASSGANYSYPSDIRLDLQPHVARLAPVAAMGLFPPSGTDDVQSSGPPIVRAATLSRVYQASTPAIGGNLSR